MKVCDRCRVPGCLLDYGGKACRNARKQECHNPCATIEDARRTIADTRPADVDTVTRCKDCGKSDVTEFGKRYCKEPMGCFCGCIPVEDDYFCSGGRRKDGAE